MVNLKHASWLAAAAGLAASTAAVAVPVNVDLTGWTSDGGGNWVVQAGNDSVLQTVNGQPTVFYEPGANAQGTALSGEITVQTTGDDDFVGFVLGYQAGEDSSASADYWLVDWKQGDQSGALDGLALSHVTDATGPANPDFWQHTGGVDEVARASNLGSTGWADNTTYSFDLVFTADLIQVYVDGVLELDVSAAAAGVASYSDGAFGFYNYSQDNVLYAGITEDDDIIIEPPSGVPEPETLALFTLGLTGLMLRRRKRT